MNSLPTSSRSVVNPLRLPGGWHWSVCYNFARDGLIGKQPMRSVLNSLAGAAPEWLKGQLQADWVDRYQYRIEDYRLPVGKQAREDYAVVIGKDGASFLSAISAAEAPAWLAEIPALETVRRVWVQNFSWEQGELRWRAATNVPAAGGR